MRRYFYILGVLALYTGSIFASGKLQTSSSIASKVLCENCIEKWKSKRRNSTAFLTQSDALILYKTILSFSKFKRGCLDITPSKESIEPSIFSESSTPRVFFRNPEQTPTNRFTFKAPQSPKASEIPSETQCFYLSPTQEHINLRNSQNLPLMSPDLSAEDIDACLKLLPPPPEGQEWVLESISVQPT